MTDVELTVVAGTFVARSGKEADLAAVLARYVVLTRSVTGVATSISCRRARSRAGS